MDPNKVLPVDERKAKEDGQAAAQQLRAIRRPTFEVKRGCSTFTFEYIVIDEARYIKNVNSIFFFAN